MAGNVFVFRIRDEYKPYANITYPSFCDLDLYVFAFWSIITRYIIIAIIIFLVICFNFCEFLAKMLDDDD